MGDINHFFSKSEFTCKCGCGRDNISMELIERLTRLRTVYGRPIIINSGCRCIEHNKKEGGVPNSPHICEGKDGEAVDIKSNSGECFDLFSCIFMYKLFNRIGVAKTFVHVDVSKTLPQDVIWTY